jgi:hypothetical protein
LDLTHVPNDDQAIPDESKSVCLSGEHCTEIKLTRPFAQPSKAIQYLTVEAHDVNSPIRGV